MLPEDELKRMNEFLQDTAGVDHFCAPHWSEKSVICSTKPQTGLIYETMEQYDIDLDKSYFVGDRASDIECGQNIGIKTVLLESGYGTKRLEKNIMADYTYADLMEFVKRELVCAEK